MSRFLACIKPAVFVILLMMLVFFAANLGGDSTGPLREKTGGHAASLPGQEESRLLVQEESRLLVQQESRLLVQEESRLQAQRRQLMKAAVPSQENFVSLEIQNKDDLPEDLRIALKYTRHLLAYPYILTGKGNVNVRSDPDTGGKSLRGASAYDCFEYIETVRRLTPEGGIGEKWIHVAWQEEGKKKFGFIRSDLTILRTFRFATMFAQVLREEAEFAEKISYINNYRNMTGLAPARNEQDIDRYGNSRDQAAPGYEDPVRTSDFRYIDDGTLISILEKKDEWYHVKVHGTGEPYTCWVPEQYVPAWKTIGPLRKVIVIDLKNQNEVLFEKDKEGWMIVSYSLATTGAKALYKAETAPGSYYLIEKRDKFDYLDDVTREVTGYAPYAVRFSGGAYIHGVPVQYKFEDGKRIDPGMREDSPTLGTVPLSHKCVRNYTSHAKFISEWAELGKTAVIVIQ